MSRSDRMIGIALGLLVGVAIVVAFALLGGAGSIDDPGLERPAGVEGSPAGGGPGGR